MSAAFGNRGKDAETEGERVGLARELGDARRRHGGAPCHGAAHRARGAHDGRDEHLGKAVLQRADHAVGCEQGFEVVDGGLVVELLGHEEDDVVGPLHLVGCERGDGHVHVHGTGDGRAVLVQGVDVRLVARNELDGHAALREVGPHNRAERARSEDRSFHDADTPFFSLSLHTRKQYRPSAGRSAVNLDIS